jgi:hypothetical protein
MRGHPSPLTPTERQRWEKDIRDLRYDTALIVGAGSGISASVARRTRREGNYPDTTLADIQDLLRLHKHQPSRFRPMSK